MIFVITSFWLWRHQRTLPQKLRQKWKFAAWSDQEGFVDDSKTTATETVTLFHVLPKKGVKLRFLKSKKAFGARPAKELNYARL